ncbi:partial Bacillopeptidase F, partial [Candidatus Brocadiaceae bacterium]
VGIPTFAFLDSANTVTQHWTVTSNPVNPKWETTGSSYHTAPFSFSDSPTGNYVANATVTLTSTNNINLTQYQQPKLSFWTKYDIESDWDAGFVQISTNNGSTWTNLSMPNSVAASGNGKQTPAGAPVYEGVLSAWTKQEVSLTPYAGQNVKLRFELRTDGSIHKQGWELDDIGIYVYTVVPVELTSFTSSLNNGTVSLQWSTATELNNKGFVVERSINGVSWESAGFVEGRGTTSESVTYRYTEKATVIGTIFYRLKQTDFDGTYRVYGPVSVENTVPVEYALEQNYPNPFNPSTVITFSLPKEEQVRLSVLNTLGEEVDVVTNQRFQAGVHQLNYQPQQLAAGVYFYKVQAGSFTQIKKMMLLK